MAASKLGRIVNEIEESFIAIILGLMTIITFANVIARYVFNSNILWALEATVFLFAWLILVGVSYCVKITAHLGVDAVLNIVPPATRKIMTLAALGCCLTFTLLLLKGSWDYWWLFANKRSFLEVNDVPMPAFLQFLADWLNEGEAYEKMPRFIPYFALPLGMALLLYRFVEAGYKILTGRQDLLIASHEAEDLVEEAVAQRDAGGSGPDDPPDGPFSGPSSGQNRGKEG